MYFLSAGSRANLLRELSQRSFDLTIIGGGITGAGIALDAASRGLRVALIEKGDFASGTSSKSTKLIHGGLRYLKQLEVKLVREVGRERAVVHRLAPHLVSAEKMLLPLIKNGTYSQMTTSFGLWVYDVLAGVQGTDKRKMLTKAETLAKEPLLRSDILVGGGFYAEYRTDDARLTIENIKTAHQYRALSANYVTATGFRYDKGALTGVDCRDELEGKTFSIHSKYIINAAGPWVDKLRKKDNSMDGKHLFLSKGVHIVVPRHRFPLQQAVYFDNTDGRMIFAVPRHRTTYIGTTDTPFEGNINNIPVDLSDVEYLIQGVNNMFTNIGLTIADVESSWAGVRPLIHEAGKPTTAISRKDELFVSDSGLISIAGGKLTGYRKMAQRAVDLVGKQMEASEGRQLPRTQTHLIPLNGGPFTDSEEVNRYQEAIAERLTEKGLNNALAAHMVANYGKNTERILDKWSDFRSASPEVTLARAEAWYAREHELAYSLLDFYIRRSGRLYFHLPSIAPSMQAVAEDFLEAFSWSRERMQAELAGLQRALKDVRSFQQAEDK